MTLCSIANVGTHAIDVSRISVKIEWYSYRIVRNCQNIVSNSVLVTHNNIQCAV